VIHGAKAEYKARTCDSSGQPDRHPQNQLQPPNPGHLLLRVPLLLRFLTLNLQTPSDDPTEAVIAAPTPRNVTGTDSMAKRSDF
jgi:hypothetical protein